MLHSNHRIGLLLLLLLVIFQGGAGSAGAGLPLAGEWTERGTVIPRGSNGSWDDTDVRMGCVISFHDSLFLYYVGADHQRPDGDAGNMAIGLARSADGVTFTKYSGNPLIVFRPTGDAEECAEFPQAVVLDDGTIRMYWGGNTSIGGGLVRCDIYLSTSSDGVHWSSGSKVIDYGNIGTGGGDEIWPIGLLHAPGGTATGTGSWHMWICGDRTPVGYSAKLAVSDDGISWQEQNESPVLTDYLWQESVCPILHEDGSVTVLDFCGCETGAGREIRFRNTNQNSLHSYSSVIDAFNDDPWWPGTVGVVADSSAGLWRLFWPNRASDIGGVINMKTAPLGSLPQNYPPQASFTADPMNGTFEFPLQVDFDAAASDDPDGAIVSYAWDFGDGSDSTLAGPAVTHSYQNPGGGSIAVTLTVTDDQGAGGDVTHQLYFSEPGQGLEVTQISKTNYQAVYLQEDQEYYVDRTYTISDIPGGHQGLLWIKTANDDKSSTEEDFLSFVVNQDVTVYVGYDHRAASLPDWITDHYAVVGDGVGVSDVGASPLMLWSRDVPAGNVVMGGNMAAGASGAASMYIIMLRALGPPTDTQPPAISGLAATGISHDRATVSWTTDEPSDSQVEYGLTAAYGSATELDTALVTEHAFQLTGLSPATVYHYRALSGDAAGNRAASGDNFFQTESVADQTAPVLSGVTVSGISDTSAVLSWSTDEPADSRVEYGLAAELYNWTMEDTVLSLDHSMELLDLTPFTEYYFRILGRDAWGNQGATGDSSFTTRQELPEAPGRPEHYDD